MTVAESPFRPWKTRHDNSEKGGEAEELTMKSRHERSGEMRWRLDGFKALVEDAKNASYFMEEVDGSFRPWRELSAEAKLEHVARDAAFYDVPFEAFAEAVPDVLGDLRPAAREESMLRLVLRSVRELHGLEKLLPDDGRLEPPPPLIERFQEMLGKTSLADLKAGSQGKQPGRPKSRDKGMER